MISAFLRLTGIIWIILSLPVLIAAGAATVFAHIAMPVIDTLEGMSPEASQLVGRAGVTAVALGAFFVAMLATAQGMMIYAVGRILKTSSETRALVERIAAGRVTHY